MKNKSIVQNLIYILMAVAFVSFCLAVAVRIAAIANGYSTMSSSELAISVCDIIIIVLLAASVYNFLMFCNKASIDPLARENTKYFRRISWFFAGDLILEIVTDRLRIPTDYLFSILGIRVTVLFLMFLTCMLAFISLRIYLERVISAANGTDDQDESSGEGLSEDPDDTDKD
jgi:hypothetical protein